ncbi:SET domain-containing protein [Aaosphaeria arxii CBS 175.79]|uniref:SET domain-containing protein n=1 Tax=Aaosphaeria arxii CBS 175.79 TaxID=1450172 RepID=A0A6A5XMQ1_9PLEO|nr:SET domain-containing protein [Aaosphaeria arxii CBS 175.79]KAF2014127.1 SET domain-containing protein [Aaosphaeria arxii CBS 175.79]
MWLPLSTSLSWSLLVATTHASFISCDRSEASLHIFDVPSWLSLNFSCLGSPLPYTILPAPGKGLGVFAPRSLIPGDIIMREPPILVINPPPMQAGKGYPRSEIDSRVRIAFEALSSSEQDEVLSLTYYNPPSQKVVDPLNSIFRSNAYNTGSRVGLFPKIARINHSCRPNTSYYWNERLGKRMVYATRHIEEGEELSVSYIPLLLAHADRQKRLDAYGFTCTCEACSATKHKKTSDQRRTRIGQLFPDLTARLTLEVPTSVAANKSAHRMAEQSIELMQLVEEEQLADYYAQVYRSVAVSLARLQQWDSASIWSSKSYDIFKMADEQSRETKEMEKLTRIFVANWNEDVDKQTEQRQSQRGR